MFVDLVFVSVAGNVGRGPAAKPTRERSCFYMDAHLVALECCNLTKPFTTFITRMLLQPVLRVHGLHVTRHVLDHLPTNSAGLLLAVISFQMLFVSCGIVECLGADMTDKSFVGMMVYPVVRKLCLRV